MIQKLPDETLLQVYQDSVELELEDDFIQLLQQELKRRGMTGVLEQDAVVSRR